MKRSKAKNGILAISTIISLQHTPMFINNHPQITFTVQFNTADGQAITATGTEVVEQTALATVQPGDILPIRYNIENPQDIAIVADISQEEFQRAVEESYLQRGIYTEETIYLMKNGIKAQGLILSSSPLNIVEEDIVAFEVVVKVTRPNGGDFITTTIKKAPQEYSSALVPGKIAEVYYLPEAEDNIALKISKDG